MTRSATHVIRLLAMSLMAGSVTSVLQAEPVSFNREIRPILSNNCFFCHGPDEKTREAGLRLDVREAALAEKDGGRAIVPGDPAASGLVQRIKAVHVDDRMPPAESKKQLSAPEIATLERWIAEGAAYEKHWAFETIDRPGIPPSRTDAQTQENGIDAFLDERLAQAGVMPLEEADRYTLIRRLYLDLLGVLPLVEEVDAFAQEASPNAYERLVDRLLASPHHGERWGRHWLDQARYADSNGYAPDGDRSMWPYRDWVIDALNRDMPFDQFTVVQLAGDLLENPSRDQLVATGFHRNTLINTEGGTDAEQFRNEAMVDRTNTTGAVWMGLTLGCAQCHTHKFDPITHEEYYQFFAFFNNSEDKNSRHPVLELRTPEDETELRRRREALAVVKKEKGDKETIERMEKEIREFERRAPTTMIMGDRKERRRTHVHIRGDFLRHGVEVHPGAPEWLPPMPQRPEKRSRLDLARWLVDPTHPLTARVTVNRLWMHHFGRGLVETENDFGLQGTLPSHPGLLDWLSSEFIRLEWSMKSLHRMMVTAAAYRRSSRHDSALAAVDPLNKLLGRQNRPRVEAEIIRDIALSASGLLARRVGGPSVFPPQPEGIYAFTQNKKNWRESQGEDRYRRGLYTFFYRSAPHPMLATFDTPNFQALCTRRERSNTPLQSLQVANDRMFIEFARGVARRTLLEPNQTDVDTRVAHAVRLCLARPADGEEIATLTAYYFRQRAIYERDGEAARALAGERSLWPEETEVASAAAWTALARVLLNLDEFVSRG